MRPEKSKVKVIGWSLILVVCATAFEIVSWVAVNRLADRGIVYVPSLAADPEAYARNRDTLLGWPSPGNFGGSLYDTSGSRVEPAFPDPSTPACVSLYGDSFTWGAEVSNEAAWSNQLARLMNCRVGNNGVAGYGTDQSLLRFLRNTGDRAPTVLLGYMSENLVRNTTRLFSELYRVSTGDLTLKPRFVLGRGGELELLPMPDLPAGEYSQLLAEPERYLDHDYLVPGGPSGTVRPGFPYTLTVARAIRSFRVRSWLRGEPYWTEFYRPGHPSQALEITVQIMQAFYNEARSRGQRPVVLFFPLTDDLERFQRDGVWIYQSLMDQLSDRAIALLNLGPGLAQYLGDRKVASIFTKPRGGHLNEEGNRVVAGLVQQLLEGNDD